MDRAKLLYKLWGVVVFYRKHLFVFQDWVSFPQNEFGCLQKEFLARDIENILKRGRLYIIWIRC